MEIHRSKEETEYQSPTVGCSCGEHDEELPEMDVQQIPHAVRHAAIFGAIESLLKGKAMVISATHDPVPLMMQLKQRHGDAYNTKYLDQRPERWRILIRRVT